MLMPTRIIFLLPLLLVACDGSFPLFGAVDAPQGVTAKQEQNDISLCKTEAESQASKSGERVKAFFGGATALEDDKTLQRGVFAECMTAKGYAVVPVQTTKNQAAQQIKPAQVKHS